MKPNAAVKTLQDLAVSEAPGTRVNRHVESRNRALATILRSAAAVFARRGFDGATTGQVASEAGVAKATVHYYFDTKENLYMAVLDQVFVDWAGAIARIERDSGPLAALSRYIDWKVEYSRESPDLTRVWAMEVLAGAPRMQAFLNEKVRKAVEDKGDVIRAWIAEGKMAPIDPAHLFFMLWATTQTYAECEAQIKAVLDKEQLDEEVFQAARETVSRVLLTGLGIKA
ncbi:MAG: TetR family transcriptional regulator C-terminal domain-containing protein [Mesorhizobium sp.]|nr:TetR family transcriptional regulator C-terminal domain-containing protein [Mesorhizobium sp.]MBL8579162.1 TetR family transcriptional regulator C-terminal domain-containing protein [Mesorhizobium sp.]